MRLVLVDAANCFYRAFFALPPLRAPDGQASHAILGFVNMLRKAIREEAPDALVIVSDAPGKSFRHEVYADYKATRDAQPEDLAVQFPFLAEVAEGFRVPLLELPGYEADDVIATLVARAPSDAEVVIVTTDKDLMQLVSERVVLLDTMKDRRFGPAEVEERFGVPPEKVLDLRALVGDPSDNIPGVKGIGEKGAAKLLAEWGDLENLLAHAGELEAKRPREALSAHAEDARLSRRLATLVTDAPVEFDAAAFACQPPDVERLRALYARLGFGRLLEELEASPGDAAAAPAPAEVAVKTSVIADATALEKLVGRLTGEACIRLHPVLEDTVGGLPALPVGLAFALSEGEAAWVRLAHPVEPSLVPAAAPDGIAPERCFEALRPLLERSAGRAWLAGDAKLVRSVFAEQGIELGPPGFDVGIAAFLVDPAGQRGSHVLAERHLGRRLRPREELTGRGAKARPLLELEPAELAAWAGEEVCALAALEQPLRAALERDGLQPLYEQVELPLTGVLSAMERHGVRVDEAALAALSSEFERELARLEGRIYETAGERFTIGSPKQLQQILFEKLELPSQKKTKTGFSTDESVLESLAGLHELPALVLEHRRLAKLKSTYVDALPPLVDPRTGRIHPSFNQTGAATGRLSCSGPNLQNIPIRTESGVRIREAFVPAEGCRLVSADYSQVELRILAHFSGDESLRAAFSAGEDVHRRTAAEVAGIEPDAVDAELRARAKAINFGIVYGLSPFGLAQQLGIPQEEARSTIEAYFARYAGVRRFLDRTLEQAREAGYVTTLLGRRRYLPELASRNRAVRSGAERMATNTVIQGTAADLIKKAMLEVAEGLSEAGCGAQLMLQVHDELVLEVPESELGAASELVRTRMEGVYALDVPLVVEIGDGASWREAH